MTAQPTSEQQAPSQLRFATTHLRTGPRVHYAEQGEASGEPMVLLHGYTDSWFSFSRLLPHLAPRRYHAYALSLRGHGDSDRPATGYQIHDFAADVVAFLDAVGIARATLVGHSLSSLIARRVAETHPGRVERLVLLGAIGTPVNVGVREFLEGARQLQDPVSETFVRDFQASTLHLPVPEPFFEQVVAESRKLPAHVWRGVAEGLLAVDDSAELGRIEAPTLLLWGEQDGYFLRDEQERLVAAIPGARLVVYPDTGHDLHWERPEQVARDLDAFLGDA